MRGNFRYSCTTSGHDDRDDLVFAVSTSGPQPPSASFTYACSGRSCTFTDTSTDPENDIDPAITGTDGCTP